jgi:hypothetical protein
MAEFKGMQTYVRKATEEKVTGVEISAAKKKVEADKTDKAVEEKKKPIVLETNFKITDPSEANAGSGGGRGGRGGERGGRGGDRGGRGGRGGDRPTSSREGGRGGDRPSRGGRGGGRGGAPGPSAGAGPSAGGRRGGPGVNIAIEDTNAFPSLN